MGKPDINENTAKILTNKQKRTGESYMSPQERNLGANSRSQMDSSSMASFNLLSYRQETDKCPFSINDNASEAQLGEKVIQEE